MTSRCRSYRVGHAPTCQCFPFQAEFVSRRLSSSMSMLRCGPRLYEQRHEMIAPCPKLSPRKKLSQRSLTLSRANPRHLLNLYQRYRQCRPVNGPVPTKSILNLLGPTCCFPVALQETTTGMSALGPPVVHLLKLGTPFLCKAIWW